MNISIYGTNEGITIIKKPPGNTIVYQEAAILLFLVEYPDCYIAAAAALSAGMGCRRNINDVRSTAGCIMESIRWKRR